MNSIRILIVDDLPEVRHGLATILKMAAKKASPSIEVVGEAQDGHEAVRKAQLLHPDVVLMDLEMPELDGWAATQSLKSTNPSIFVVALTIHGNPAARQKADQVGADAFVEKGAPLAELVQAIQSSRITRSSG